MLNPVIDVRYSDPIRPSDANLRITSVDQVRLGTMLTVPANARARQEHCTVSWALADALGISPGVGLADHALIRVGHAYGRPDPACSALYMVIGTYWTFPVQREIRFYSDHEAQIGGARRLYGGEAPNIAWVKVWSESSPVPNRS